jgi:hypothetical protein
MSERVRRPDRAGRAAPSGDQFSGGFDHMAGFNAAGTYHHAFGLTVLKRPNRLKIRVEASFVDIMRMANVAANHWFFSTDLTFSGHF